MTPADTTGITTSTPREHTGHALAPERVFKAIQHATGTKMKSQAAGKMGHGTREVGDLVAGAL